MKKRVSAIVLVVALTLSIMSGCSAAGGSGETFGAGAGTATAKADTLLYSYLTGNSDGDLDGWHEDPTGNVACDLICNSDDTAELSYTVGLPGEASYEKGVMTGTFKTFTDGTKESVELDLTKLKNDSGTKTVDFELILYFDQFHDYSGEGTMFSLLPGSVAYEDEPTCNKIADSFSGDAGGFACWTEEKVF